MNNNTDLITNNLKLIHYVISKINYKNNNEYEDLFQSGCIGLINASNTYNNKLNIKFSTYAYTCIKNEILKYIKKLPKYNLGLDKEICEGVADCFVADTVAVKGDYFNASRV